jgi:UDP-GlcNAc:undecaprenyl-phosphate GlcNAc-1-phosphate transferase
MNAVNFIDGLDGLVAGVAIIANSVFFVYSYVVTYEPTTQSAYFNLPQFVSAVLIGACIGFLPLNWHPAKLFMGDAGALLVGLMMAAAAISVTGAVDPESMASSRQLLPAFIPILLPLAILMMPLLDFALAVIRRLRAGKSPFSADRKHLHHRLLDMGHTHFQAVLIFYCWTAVFAIGTLLFVFVPTVHNSVAIGFIAVGFIVSAIFTVAPMTKRKRQELEVQSMSADEPAAALAAQLDPLDAASTRPTPIVTKETP